jgi:DNA-binding NarL/FixJ family response regulator
MNAQSQTHILIAERQAATRSALSGFLQGQLGLNVVGETADSQELLDQIELTRPDLVLLDWDLLGEPGGDLISDLRQTDCHPRVIVLGVRQESAPAALDAGANEFVCKGEQPSRLLTAIYDVLSEHDIE